VPTSGVTDRKGDPKDFVGGETSFAVKGGEGEFIRPEGQGKKLSIRFLTCSEELMERKRVLGAKGWFQGRSCERLGVWGGRQKYERQVR